MNQEQKIKELKCLLALVGFIAFLMFIILVSENVFGARLFVQDCGNFVNCL